MSSTAATIAEKLGISDALLISRGLRRFSETDCLVTAEIGKDGREHLLVSAAAKAWRNLKDAALAENIDVFIVSGFRSISRQADIIRCKLDAGMKIEEILTVCAPPGFSEHHTGRAVDVSTPDSPMLETAFDQTPAYDWLTRHANSFGFFLSYPIGNSLGYQYEPWHWCFDEARFADGSGPL